MAEGSLWVYGQTRLRDFFEDRISFRELANRFWALPQQPPNRAPIWDVLVAEGEQAEAARKADEIDDVLNRYR